MNKIGYINYNEKNSKVKHSVNRDNSKVLLKLPLFISNRYKSNH